MKRVACWAPGCGPSPPGAPSLIPSPETCVPHCPQASPSTTPRTGWKFPLSLTQIFPYTAAKTTGAPPNPTLLREWPRPGTGLTRAHGERMVARLALELEALVREPDDKAAPPLPGHGAPGTRTTAQPSARNNPEAAPTGAAAADRVLSPGPAPRALPPPTRSQGPKEHSDTRSNVHQHCSPVTRTGWHSQLNKTGVWGLGKGSCRWGGGEG